MEEKRKMYKWHKREREKGKKMIAKRRKPKDDIRMERKRESLNSIKR